MEASVGISTEVVAWWGAVVATLVLLWDIFKWKQSGPNIRVTAQSGMKFIGGMQSNDQLYVTVRVTNIGDRPTTITVIGLRYYKSLFDRIRRKVDQHFIIPKPEIGGLPLPYVLNIGQEWMGGVEQTEDLVEMATEGLLFVEVCDSVHSKPHFQKIRIRENAT